MFIEKESETDKQLEALISAIKVCQQNCSDLKTTNYNLQQEIELKNSELRSKFKECSELSSQLRCSEDLLAEKECLLNSTLREKSEIQQSHLDLCHRYSELQQIVEELNQKLEVKQKLNQLTGQQVFVSSRVSSF